LLEGHLKNKVEKKAIEKIESYCPDSLFYRLKKNKDAWVSCLKDNKQIK
jgi:hypothetical protein